MSARATRDRARPPASLARRLTQATREAAFASRAYALTLRGSGTLPERRPSDIWPGDTDTANAMFQGRFRAAGEEIAIPNEMPWSVAPPSARWLEEMCCFEWLRDFRAAGGPAAAQRARDLTASWILAFGHWSRPAWRADLLGRRLRAWISHGDFLADGAPAGFASRFHASLQQQLRHLRRYAGTAPAGAPTVAALVGLGTAELAYTRRVRPRTRALERLDRALAQQILGDGGHVERNPMVHHRVLRDLVGLRAALRAAGIEPSAGLQSAIDRMAPMLRFFRHGDGALALFNDGLEDSRAAVDSTLAAARADGRPRVSAGQSGYERLSAGRTLVLVDVGAPPPPGLDDRAHAGCLAFEASHGRDRLIVNCGASHRLGGTWHRSMRATAAHSTVTVADTNSAELRRDGRLRRRPAEVVVSRRENEHGAQLVEASHDGYGAALGYHHHRRLVLDASGERIAGEDWLTARGGRARRAEKRTFTARFHLHPSVRASARQGGGVLLSSGKGAGWLFEVDGGELSVQDSAYLGDGRPRRTRQIALTAPISARAILSWTLSRVTG